MAASGAGRNALCYYDTLRVRLLGAGCAKMVPHITLLHWRHASQADATLDKVKREKFPKSVAFEEISLIEQRDDGVWSILETYPLRGATDIVNIGEHL